MEKLNAVKYIGLIYGILLFILGVLINTKKEKYPQTRHAVQAIPGFIIIALSIYLIVYTEENKQVKEDDNLVIGFIFSILVLIMVSDVVVGIWNGNFEYYKILLLFVIIALMASYQVSYYQLTPQGQRSAILNAVLYMFFTFILLNAAVKDNLRLLLTKCELNKISEDSGNLNGLVYRIMPIIYVISLLVLYS